MTVRVVRDQQTPTRLEIRFGTDGQRLIADLGVAEGGERDQSGPAPHDLYDAALADCKARTVLWYAKHRSIALAGVAVTVERDASQERAGVYRLRVALQLVGDLSAAQREELLRVAEKCPIERLMTEVTTVISTALAIPAGSAPIPEIPSVRR